MRIALVDVANYDWTTINPTIFGSLFQLIKNKEARRELGEHYTSEENINKIVYPLFLDDLQERLATAWDSKKDLKKLRQDLSKIKILDPACGCGNFLVVSYRHLRQLELELIVRLNNLEGMQDSMQLDGSMGLSVTLNQFCGIEIEEWPAQVARMALFLTDHQENRKLERVTGESPNRFPIVNSANIINQNSLELDWVAAFKLDENSYILGNPPFGGSTWQTKTQKEETAHVWNNMTGSGLLDYVTNWFALSAKAIKGTNCKAAFVSTSSIAQGTHPGLMWPTLGESEIEIYFAHQSFNWANESSGQAAVHCVIIGLARKGEFKDKKLWIYGKKSSTPSLLVSDNINAYLLAAPDIIISSRKKPLNKLTPIMDNGNKPTDDGILSNISDDEAARIRNDDQIAAKYLRKILGARELIHGEARNCLWLLEASPSDIRSSKELSSRVSAVKEFRLSSTKKQTVKDAARPSEFQEIRQPKKDFLAIPRITSEDREYVPMAYLDRNTIINDKISFIAECDLATFGFLSSSVFNIWNKAVSGRTRNDTLISNTITYNNFPFISLDKATTLNIEEASKEILEVRSSFAGSSLADLYGSNSMPPKLAVAHRRLDQLVLRAYGLPSDSEDAIVLARLFSLYQEMQEQLII
jgi:hypothetical protein